VQPMKGEAGGVPSRTESYYSFDWGRVHFLCLNSHDAKTTATHVILNDGDGDPQGDGAYRKSAGIHSHQGTVQVVTGHGGATVGRKGTMPVMRKITVEHGSTLVDISGDTLSAIMLNKKGEVGDRFSVIKRGQVELRRLANPWQPPGWKANAAASTSAEPPETYVTLIKAALATRVDEP